MAEIEKVEAPEPEKVVEAETKPAPPKTEGEEPESRFPQTPEDKRLGYASRKAEKGEFEPLMNEIRSLRKDLGYSPAENPLGDKSELEALRDELKGEIQSIKQEHGSERLLGQFIGAFPKYAKYEEKIRRYMNHSAYANVPIGFIADGIAGKELASESIAEAVKADAEAMASEAGGSAIRKPVGKLPDFWKMSKEEFENYSNSIVREVR
jgi:hypothetical protein